MEAQARARLADLRGRRDNVRVAELRGHLAAAARGPENLLPVLIACVENAVTIGEICGTLRDVWGEFKPSL